MATEQPVPEKAAAWLVMWECHCSDVQPVRANLPEQCPGHGRGRVAKPEQIDALVQYVGVHECPDNRKCEAPK